MGLSSWDATLANFKCCYCEVFVSTVQPQSIAPCKLTECDHWGLKRLAYKNRLFSVASLTTEFLKASGSHISTGTVCRELRKMDFHGWAAVHKPKISKHNEKVWHHWTLKEETCSVERWAMTDTSRSGSLRVGRCQDRTTLEWIVTTVLFGGGGMMVSGCSSRFGLGPEWRAMLMPQHTKTF